MAEWLCRGLQIPVQRFDSASGLHPSYLVKLRLSEPSHPALRAEFTFQSTLAKTRRFPSRSALGVDLRRFRRDRRVRAARWSRFHFNADRRAALAQRPIILY